MSLLNFIFGDPNKKVLGEMQSIVDKINSFESELEKLTDDELKNQTNKLKNELANGKTLDDILPEAFATVREASKRILQQRHFDVQLIGGIAMHQGHIAEMRTGEGKTLTATAPMYLNALEGKGVHLVTVNDYLSRIHADWMGRVYDFLGLTVSCIQQQNISYKFDSNRVVNEGDQILDVQYLVPCTRAEAYACDVTYGTNNEFGFDYLRDNMVSDIGNVTQRELNYAIVDEVDSILIDEARTPLIISAPDMESTDKYQRFSQIVRILKSEEDYKIDEKQRSSILTEAGIAKVEKALGVENIYTDMGISDVHHIEQALKAQSLFKRDKDYVVKDGEIIIIDQFTGRMMYGRRFSEGLHQAIEAKEGVKVQRESKTLATISFQNYFRLYKKLSGMTGTASTEAEEFSKIYNLEVTTIPTNKPMVRIDSNDKIYKNELAKYQALVKEVKERSSKGQPVLIGTISIENNELLSELLNKEGVKHQILNAKYHDKEAHIIAQAGRVGAVTVATNMAGRGVDIILGGYPFEEESYKKVVQLGGLCVLGTERHDSRRIDNQLRGRAGRQGDPGFSRFYISLDDDLMRIFGSDRIKNLMTKLGVPDDMPIENSMISKSIEQAQKKVETHNFDIRKHLVEYDDVMNKQRETIYKKRRKILAGLDTKETVLQSIKNEVDIIIDNFLLVELSQESLDKVYNEVNLIFSLKKEDRKPLEELIKETQASDNELDAIKGYVNKLVVETYNKLEEDINLLPSDESGLQPMRQIERQMYLHVIDTFWIEHLETMSCLRTGIGLRGYGQRDPLIEYKKESLRLFKELLSMIDRHIAYSIFKIGFTAPSELKSSEQPQNLQLKGASSGTSFQSPMEGDSGIKERKVDKIIEDKTHFDGAKVGRNDPCPCGSGKKFKHCHGK